MILLHIGVQFVDGANGDAADGGADHVSGDIKSGVHLKTDLFKIEVLQQGVAQMAGADDDQPVAVVNAQNVPDLGPEFRHVVAVTLLAEFTKAAQVLSDLGCGDVHAAAQRVGRNTNNTLVVQVIQIAVIAGETVDDCVGDFLLLHDTNPSFNIMRGKSRRFAKRKRFRCNSLSSIVPH